jgi:hypothetical protein
MGLLATLPRATRGHLGASNRTLTRATRGWLQAATAVQVVRRAGGLFITHPEEIEWYRRHDSVLYLTLEGASRARQQTGEGQRIQAILEVTLDGTSTARQIARPRPTPVPAAPSVPQRQPTVSAPAAPAPAAAQPAPAPGAPQRHRLTQRVTSALEIDAATSARLLAIPQAPQSARLAGALSLDGVSRSRLIDKRTDDEIVIITALLAKELDHG